MSIPATDPTDPTQAIQDYINAITKQFDTAEAYIHALNTEASKIQKAEKSRDYWNGQKATITYYTTSGDPDHPYNTHHKPDQNVIDHRAKADASVHYHTQLLSQAKASLLTADPNMKSLMNTLDSLLACIHSMASSGTSHFAEDVAKIQTLLTKLFSAMESKLRADKAEAIIDGDIHGDLSDAQITAYAAEMISNENDEQSALNQMSNLITQDVQAFQQESNDAKIDKASYNPIEECLWKPIYDQETADQATIDNATSMISQLLKISDAVAPEIASVMPEFVQLQVTIKEIIRKVMKILNDDAIPPKEKEGKILALLMFCLGLFNEVNQKSEGYKAKNESELAKANQAAAKMNTENIIANQQIQAEQVHNAQVMKTIMMITQIVMGAVFTLMAPGAGSALLMATMTVLTASGAMDKATEALGKAIGCQIAADIIIGICEVAVTAGGGAALDAFLSRIPAIASIADAAAKSAMEDVTEGAARVAPDVAGEGMGALPTAGGARALTSPVEGEVEEEVAEAGVKAAAVPAVRAAAGEGAEAAAAVVGQDVGGAAVEAPEAVLGQAIAGNAKETIESVAKAVIKMIGKEKLPKAVQDAVRDAIKEGTEQVAKMAAKQTCKECLNQNVAAIVMSGARGEIRQAATKAAKEATQEFLRTSERVVVARLTELAAQSAEGDVVKGAAQEAAKAVEASARSALQKSLLTTDPQAVAQLGKVAAKSAEAKIGEIPLKTTLEKSLDAAIGESVAKGVANATGKSVKSVAESASRSATKTAMTRAAWTSLYAMGSTNLLLDMVKQIGKSRGVENSEWFKNFLIFVQVVQALCEMIAMGGGSGAASKIGSTSDLSQLLQKAAQWFMMVPQSMQAGASVATFEFQEAQADTTVALQLVEIIGEMLQADWKRMQENAKRARDRFIQQQRAEISSQFAMASHLHDGDAAGIRVLSQQAV